MPRKGILAKSSRLLPILKNECGSNVRDVLDDSDTKLRNLPVLKADSKNAGKGMSGTWCGREAWKLRSWTNCCCCWWRWYRGDGLTYDRKVGWCQEEGSLKWDLGKNTRWLLQCDRSGRRTVATSWTRRLRCRKSVMLEWPAGWWKWELRFYVGSQGAWVLIGPCDKNGKSCSRMLVIIIGAPTTTVVVNSLSRKIWFNLCIKGSSSRICYSLLIWRQF